MDFPPFPGFRPEAFAFLGDLALHNDRDWFKARKATYEDEVQWPLRCLVVDAAREAGRLQIPLTGDPKHSLFRIYRDTRFSKTKVPYKTSAGAVLSRSGSRKDSGVLYIHFEPGRSFLGAGFWQPESKQLRRWRSRIVEAPDAFRTMVDQVKAGGMEMDPEDKLKRLPRGFEAYTEADFAPFLKWKSLVAYRKVPDEALHSPAFTAEVVQAMQTALPLLEFGWSIEP